MSKHVKVRTATAHTHRDRDGTVYNLGTNYGPFGAEYKVIKIPPLQQGEAPNVVYLSIESDSSLTSSADYQISCHTGVSIVAMT